MAPSHRPAATHRAGRGMNRFSSLRCLPLLLALGLTALEPGMAHAQAATSAQEYDIPAGPLAPALRRYAQQADVDIVLDAGNLASLNTAGLKGRYGVDEGFALLLRGTGYRASRSAAGYFLQPDPTQGSSVATLAELTVRGEGERQASTEGTGSYASQYVTLGKGVQSWREIPQSVSVITRQQMDDQGAVTIAEAMSYATGMTLSDYEGTEKFNSRGFGTSAQYDGIPQQGSGTHVDLAIYDRLEVLRGPSGLLTGTGEPGGVVNYVRKRPMDSAHFSAGASLGSWQHRRIEADGGGPLNEAGTARGRLVGAWQEENKFYDLGRSEPRTLYGVLEFDLTENTTLGLTGTWHERRFRNFNGLPLYADGSLPAMDDYVGTDRLSKYGMHDYGVDLTHRLGSGWVVKASYLHRQERYRGYSAFAGSALDVVTGRSGMSVGRIANDFKWDQGDVQITGPLQAFGREHWFTLGYNLSRYQSTTGSRFAWLPDWAPLQDHDFGVILDEPVINKSRSVTEQSGLYASTRIRLADPLTLVLGARWTDYSNKSRTLSPVATAWKDSTANVSNEFTPYGGLVWDLNDNLTLYASYADIFVPQSQQDVNGVTLRPRVGWQTEVGVKGQFFDNRLNTSLALFRIRDKNRAMVDAANTGCGGTPNGICYKAAGQIQSQGIEAEISGSPLPGWDMTAGYTYTHATYLEDADPANVGRRFGADVLPRHLFRLWTQYRFGRDDFQGALLGWRIGVGVQAQSDVYTASIRQGTYATASVRLGYALSKQWDAALSVNNVFDRRYLRTPGHATFYNLYGEPRSFMLNVRYTM